MQIHLLRRAAKILTDEIKKTPYSLADCKISAYDKYHKNGFITICATHDGKYVAGITQDIHALQCGNSLKEAERNLISKIHKINDD